MPGPALHSAENHTLLIQLKDGLSAIGTNLVAHITQTRDETKMLHARIDLHQAQTATAFAKLGDENASRGRVNASHVAVLVSLLVGIGGFGNAMVEMKLANERPRINQHGDQLMQAESDRRALHAEIVEERVRAAREDATAAEFRRAAERKIDRLEARP